MTNPVPRSVVEGFYKAYAARDIGLVAKFLADDVTWTISGPVNLLQFCGTRFGKAAALDMIGRQISEVYDVIGFVSEAMLIDGDRAATVNRLSARLKEDERVISFRVAHFLRFRDGKIIENLSIIDSFNAVEQVLGHAIALGEGQAATTDSDLVAV
jgi:ketosteroid isomerase-like protein